MREVIFFVCILFHISVHGQSNGYLVGPEGDTLRVEIKMPVDLLGSRYFEKLFGQVTVKHATGEINTCKPGEVRAFGFSDKQNSYAFETIPRGKYQFVTGRMNGTVIGFMQVLVKGDHAACYMAYETGVGDGSMQDQEYYTCTRTTDQQKLFLQNFEQLKTIKARLSSFYHHLPATEKSIRNKFRRQKNLKTDILKLMEDLNQGSVQRSHNF